MYHRNQTEKIRMEVCFYSAKVSSIVWHFKQILPFFHQIILDSYRVPIRDGIILSIKRRYRETTTTNFDFFIE